MLCLSVFELYSRSGAPENDIDMERTHVTISVVGGQQYSRPGHSGIYLRRTRQRGCFNC